VLSASRTGVGHSAVMPCRECLPRFAGRSSVADTTPEVPRRVWRKAIAQI